MSTDALTALSVLEAVILVFVLAVALIQVRIRLRAIADLLATLLQGVLVVEEHLRLIAPTVPQVNAPLKDIVGALPAIAEMAETVAER
jgi:uncharacterized membrane protein